MTVEQEKALGSFTQKEIYEIPESLKKALTQREKIKGIVEEMIERDVNHLYLIGAGTSYHAGFAMAYMFSRVAKIPTFTEFSMEFQYLIQPVLHETDCIIGISQSGETKDTIQTVKKSKDLGCLTIGITNNPGSRLAKTCHHALSLECGEEKSVLATKTYISQLAILAIIALELGLSRKTLFKNEYDMIWEELNSIPVKVSTILPHLHEEIRSYSQYFKFAEFCFILGGGSDYATAMEASLKLKEGARIFGQAYSTAEFPHGPITLADSRTWILAIIPHEEDQRKKNIIQLLKRIKERKATILGIYESGDDSEEVPQTIDFGIKVPNTFQDLQPMVMILAVQLLTLEIARIKGLNPDTPKFLTKVSGI